ncbi:hypothetical protein [Reinekea sp. G2M2-21]|uniref:hypothetical protein n=1 Tax=Reinekea sp. G2M2-21 TaxID=2788942 RepID=UPI0018AC0663|nr:hypothetical protein [Reinekea sp. G2M2-21]
MLEKSEKNLLQQNAQLGVAFILIAALLSIIISMALHLGVIKIYSEFQYLEDYLNTEYSLSLKREYITSIQPSESNYNVERFRGDRLVITGLFPSVIKPKPSFKIKEEGGIYKLKVWDNGYTSDELRGLLGVIVERAIRTSELL